MARYIQPTFAGGEISPNLYGRIDLAWYYNSASLMYNCYSLKFGGARKRPGFQFVNETKNSGPVRLVSFRVAAQLTYLLEFGENYIRFYFGPGIIENNAVQALNQIQVAAVPLEVATPFTADEVYELRLTQSKDVMYITHPFKGIWKLNRIGVEEFELEEFVPKWGPFKNENIEPHFIKASSQTGQGVTLTAVEYSNGFEPFTWDGTTDEDLQFSNVYFGQDALLVDDAGDSRFHQITAGKSFTIANSPSNDGSYVCVSSSFDSGKYIIIIDPGQSFVPETLSAGTVDFTGGVVFPPVDIFKPEDVGTTLRLRELTETEYDKWEPDRTDDLGADKNYTVGQLATYENNVYRNTRITGQSGVRPPLHTFGAKDDGQAPEDFLTWEFVHSNQGYVKIISYVSPQQVVVDVIETIPTSYIRAGNYLFSFSYWGPNDTYYYPRSISFHQGRLWFGSSDEFPQALWSSVSDDYENFKVNFPIEDDDGITLFIDSRKLSNIVHLLQLSDLIVHTTSSEWKVAPQGDSILTPSSVGAFSQSYVGSDILEPLTIDNDALYLDKAQRRIYSLTYQFSADTYAGDDLSVKADHLFSGFVIVDWTYAREPNDIVWLAREDGVLIGMTYMPSQDVIAFSQHHTDGIVESVEAANYLGYDVLYLVVKRVINGEEKRYIELMQSDLFSTMDDWFAVDSGLSYEGPPATTFSNLDHLEGKEIVCLGDGTVYDNLTVTGGQVTLPIAVSKAHLGLPYEAHIETLDLEIQSSEGSVQGRRVNVQDVLVRVTNSRDIQVGPTADELRILPARHDEFYSDSPEVKNGDYIITAFPQWKANPRVHIANKTPTPLEVNLVGPRVSTGGS